ncbi:MAG TPA: MFS transporter [Terriglobales bacterium]|nr:MFS transporter [Terriglobales bacterium]
MTETESFAAAPASHPGRGLTFAMAAACGIAVANIYYNQPMVGIIQNDFANPTLAGLVPTSAQLGYAIGLFLLVPLGDMMDRRRLIVGQFLVLAVALLLAAMAPTIHVLLLANLLVGIGSTVAQQIIPLAAALAMPQRRGRTIGALMSGLLGGILLSRTIAGLVAAHEGWRAMFWLAVPLALAASAWMAVILPRNHPHAGIRYGAALGSLIHLWRDERSLRGAALKQGSLFAGFTAFWAILALHLEEPRFGLGADIAGLFGIVAMVGVSAAPLAGRLADRRGPHLVIALAAGLALLSWILFGLWNSVPGLIVGVILLDFAVQSAMVSNQHIVFALRPEARNRLNTIYMTSVFLGGSLGSAGATVVWHHGGWLAVSAYGAALALLSLGLEVIFRDTAHK